MDEVELLFDDSAFEAIAEEAARRKTGARALRSIIEDEVSITSLLKKLL